MIKLTNNITKGRSMVGSTTLVLIKLNTILAIILQTTDFGILKMYVSKCFLMAFS